MDLHRGVKIVENENKLILLPNLTTFKLGYLIIPTSILIFFSIPEIMAIYLFVKHQFFLTVSDYFWILGLPMLVYLFIIIGITRIPSIKQSLQITPMYYYIIVVTFTILIPSVGLGFISDTFLVNVTKGRLLYILAFSNFSMLISLNLGFLALSFYTSIVLERRGREITGYSYFSYYILPFVKIQRNSIYKSQEPMKMRFFIQDKNRESVKDGQVYASYSYTLNEFLNLQEGPNKKFLLGLYGPVDQGPNIFGDIIIQSKEKKDILETIQRISTFCKVEIVKIPAIFEKVSLSGAVKNESAKDGRTAEQILTEMKT